MGRKAIVIFCALALALSWGIQFALLAMVGMESDKAPFFLLANMWSPTLLALGFILFRRPARQNLALRLGKISYWPLGVLYATAVAFGAVALFLSQGWADHPWFLFTAEGVTVNGGPWKLGEGEQSWPFFAANVLATAAFFAVTNMIAAVGEEFAWRGFLQGHMVRQFGLTGGIVLLGLFWSFWHLPMLLQGYNHPDAPILGSFVLFPVELVAMSFFLGWLTIRSGSFIPAALAHAAGNSIQEGVISRLDLVVPHLWTSLYALVPAVVVGLLCWAALAAGRKREHRPTALVPA